MVPHDETPDCRLTMTKDTFVCKEEHHQHKMEIWLFRAVEKILCLERDYDVTKLKLKTVT